MTRLEKLNDCLSIARKHNNKFMEANILAAIEQETNNPSGLIYPDEKEDNSDS